VEELVDISEPRDVEDLALLLDVHCLEITEDPETHTIIEANFNQGNAARLIQRFVDAKVAEAWNIRPIEEAPKDGTLQFVFFPSEGRWVYARWTPIYGRWWMCALEPTNAQPTHYIPSLPTPPAQATEREGGE